MLETETYLRATLEGTDKGRLIDTASGRSVTSGNI